MYGIQKERTEDKNLLNLQVQILQLKLKVLSLITL